MKAGYIIERGMYFTDSISLAVYNFLNLNTIRFYELEKDESVIKKNCVGIWKLKNLKSL